jgi:hypothetical protein
MPSHDHEPRRPAPAGSLTYEALAAHVGHEIRATTSAGTDAAVRCHTCSTLLLTVGSSDSARGQLELRYTGPPARLDERALAHWLTTTQAAADDPSIANAGRSAPRRPEVPSAPAFECDTTIVELWDRALAAEAVLIPDGVTAELFTSNDADETFFTFVVYPEGGRQLRGVTAGWRSADALTAGQDTETDEPDAVRAALQVFVSELNDALLGSSEDRPATSA